jgi:hypothetical protein
LCTEPSVAGEKKGKEGISRGAAHQKREGGTEEFQWVAGRRLWLDGDGRAVDVLSGGPGEGGDVAAVKGAMEW